MTTKTKKTIKKKTENIKATKKKETAVKTIETVAQMIGYGSFGRRKTDVNFTHQKMRFA